MIEIKNLSKSYGKVKALESVDLQALPGKVTGILGPNGCGKTTLIKSVLGLVVADSGDVLVTGQNVLNGCDYRNEIGYVPQNAQFPNNLTAVELFAMIEDIRKKKSLRQSELIDLFDLHPHLNKPLGTLSGGTRQKVALVLGFMFDPQVLILDEPTVGLDPLAVVRLKKLVRDAASKNKTVLLVTHMMAEIEQLVDQMFFLLEGQVRFSGHLDSIRERAQTANLEDAIVQLMKREKNG